MARKTGVDDFLLTRSVEELQALEQPWQPRKLLKANADLDDFITSGTVNDLDPSEVPLAILDQKGFKHRKYEAICDFVTEHMENNGSFIRATTGELFFFDNQTRNLLPIPSMELSSHLDLRYKLNPASEEAKRVLSRLRSISLACTQPLKVFKQAYWDKASGNLYLDKFDGDVLVLDGKAVTQQPNGTNGILFFHPPQWKPFRLLDSVADEQIFSRLLIDDINFTTTKLGFNPVNQKLLFLMHILSIFFRSAIREPAILFLIGEHGSGKTMAAQKLLRWLFGPGAKVSIVEGERQDGLVAKITHDPVVVLDNIEKAIEWLETLLACIVSGANIPRRRFYTNNDLVDLQPDGAIIVTARHPVLNRSDVSDRAIVLQLERFHQFANGVQLLEQIDRHRDELWTVAVHGLNRVVQLLQERGLESWSTNRLSDFWALGRVIATSIGQQEEFLVLADLMSAAQARFTVDGDPLCQVLEMTLKDDSTNLAGMEIDAAGLYVFLSEKAAAEKLDWPYKSAIGLGNHLSAKWASYQQLLGALKRTDLRGRTYYTFKGVRKCQTVTS